MGSKEILPSQLPPVEWFVRIRGILGLKRDSAMCNLYDIGPVRGVRGKGLPRLVAEKLSEVTRAYGIRKTDPGVVVRRAPEGQEAEAEVMRWGFSRHFNPAVNNARRDKLDDGMWRFAWKAGQRCVIPVSTFYEWSGPKGAKQTHAFQSLSEVHSWLWMAGIWEDHPEQGLSYAMITDAAQGVVAEVHDRMPVILREDAISAFLEGSLISEGGRTEGLLPSDSLAVDLRRFRCLNPLKAVKPGPPVEDGWLF